MESPVSRCFFTTSSTAERVRSRRVASAIGRPSSRSRKRPSRSLGRGRLPVCVVRIRSVLRFTRRSVVGPECRDPGHVRIQHAGRRLGRRARRVPHGPVARDRELRLIGDLRRRVVRELLRFRVEADQGAALAAVADPDLVLTIRPDIVRLGERHRDVILDDLSRLRVDLPELAVVEAAVPDHAGRVDAETTDGARLGQRRVLGELLRARVELADLAATELGEPDVLVLVERNAVGGGALGGHLPHGGLAGLTVPLADHVADDDREPDVVLRVDDRRVAAALAAAGGVHRIARDRAGPRVEPADREPDGLGPEHVTVAIDGEPVRIRLGVGHHPVLDLGGARIDASDPVRDAAVRVPDVALGIEVGLLGPALLVAGVELRIEGQVVLDVHRLGERRLVDGEGGVGLEPAPGTAWPEVLAEVGDDGRAIRRAQRARRDERAAQAAAVLHLVDEVVPLGLVILLRREEALAVAVHALLLEQRAARLARIELVVGDELDLAGALRGEAELALADAHGRALAERDVERPAGAGGELDLQRFAGEPVRADRDLVFAGKQIDGPVATAARVHHEEHVLVHVHQVHLRRLERLGRVHDAGEGGGPRERVAVGRTRRRERGRAVDATEAEQDHDGDEKVSLAHGDSFERGWLGRTLRYASNHVKGAPALRSRLISIQRHAQPDPHGRLDIVRRYLVTSSMIPSGAMQRSTTMDGGSHMTDRRDMLLTLGVIGGAMLLGPSRVALAAEDCQQAIRDQAIGNALLDKYVAAVNAHDTSSFAEIHTESYIQHSGRSPSGLPAQIENFRGIFARMPDVHTRVEDRIIAGDKVVARMTFSATHTQPLQGIAPTGRRFTLRTIDIWRVENGKFAEHWDIVDFPGLQKQLRGE